MSLAGKFGNFEIKKTDRISKEDQEWLSRREKMYKRALMIQKSVYDIYKSEDETYTEEDRKEFSSFTVSDFGVPKRVSQIQDSYISGIFSYFSGKYHVELKNEFEHYDYNRELYRYSNKEPVKDLVIDEIDYHTVLDKIFDQLGGLSFQEKSMKEVKDALKDKCYLEGRDQWKIKISGKKLIYTGGSCYKSRYSDEYEFNSTAFQTFFTKGLKCACCGIEGKYFGKEKDFNAARYHLNLYALDESGNEVLMTKDHIVPRSKGGASELYNYQTMCVKCNIAKGNN